MLTNPSFIESGSPQPRRTFFCTCCKPLLAHVSSRVIIFMPQYYFFHKPYHVLSQFSAEGDKKTLADFFPGISKNIYSVGRLDYDSEGLLLLTDDKVLTHQLLDPSFAHPRTYWVQVEGAITDAAIHQLQQGVTISVDGKKYKTKKAAAKILTPEPVVANREPPIRYRKNISTSWITLTLTEGKNRQVRKMTATIGFPTLRLIRYSIGKITLDDITPGTFKVADESVKQLLLGK